MFFCKYHMVSLLAWWLFLTFSLLFVKPYSNRSEITISYPKPLLDCLCLICAWAGTTPPPPENQIRLSLSLWVVNRWAER